MNCLETSVYLIENPEQLSCKYKLYQVKGLPVDSEDYDKNIQFLVSHLTKTTNSPCVSYKTADGTFIAQLDDFPDLPESIDVVRTNVKLVRIPGLNELHFSSSDTTMIFLAQRFLQGIIQTKLYNNSALWQPGAGNTFYNKSPDQEFRQLSHEVDLFRGFTFGVVVLPNNRIGISVDVKSKYVSRTVLPTRIDRKDFKERYQGMHCIYEYGNRWYEIKISGLNDLNSDQLTIPPDDISLFDEVHRKASDFKSQNLLSLPRNCSVLIYYTSSGDPRNVPSGLCRQVFSTDYSEVSQFHSLTIKNPPVRRKEIQFVIDRNFRDFMFGINRIELAQKPLIIDEKKLPIPDLIFGKNKVLSTKNTPNAICCSVEEFPLKKKELFYSNDAGILTKKKLERQYFILPKSIANSFGRKFEEDIKREFQRLYPYLEGIYYLPTTIVYEDSVQKSVYALASAIIKAVEENDAKNGFGVVMIPDVRSKRMKKEDELANIVMRLLKERELYVSIIHSRVSTESYEYGTTDNGREDWRLVFDRRQQGKYRGYIKNVVLNKVLILNSLWPFALNTPLNADLTIGIDVKNDMAGFVVVHKNGADIAFYSSTSTQKERLEKKHVCSKLFEIISNEQKLLPSAIKNIVIQRQGRLFSCEKAGIEQAITRLKGSNVIPQESMCTSIEIKTTSRVPFRMFKVEPMTGEQKENVENPMIGTYFMLSDSEAFLATTGTPYSHFGTAKPLHVIKIEGTMPLTKLLEDVFYLANLTWTKIDDCSRLPLTIKMNDIRLREFAGEYDQDALRFGLDEEE
ncbi:MAG: hypothetical protein ABSG33_01315 [Candidatus Bathyarchaeia archaeon]|jgi:hypothetical protein